MEPSTAISTVSGTKEMTSQIDLRRRRLSSSRGFGAGEGCMKTRMMPAEETGLKQAREHRHRIEAEWRRLGIAE